MRETAERVQQKTTLSVPIYEGRRFRELVNARGGTAINVLADIINDACDAAGIGVAGTAVTVERRQGTHTFFLILFEAYLIELPEQAMEALADALAKVADDGGYIVFDLDHEFEVCRQGSGVILEMAAMLRRTKKTIAARIPMSPDMARKIAKTIREALKI